MKCEVCHANNASAIWQPFGPATTADFFVEIGCQDLDYPTISVCTPCQQRFQQRQGPLEFTYRRFAYRACKGRVELALHREMAGRLVRKADLLCDRIIDVSATVALTQDGSLAIIEVVVTLASQRRMRYRTDGEGSNLLLPIKYWTWDRRPAGASG